MYYVFLFCSSAEGHSGWLQVCSVTIDTDVKVSLWYGDLSLLGIYPRVGWTGLHGSSPFRVLRNPYLVPQWLYTFNCPWQ